MYRDRSGNDLARHIEGAVGAGVHTPLDQCHIAALDFNTGDAAGMNAASRVVVIGGFCWQDRAVRVPGNQNAAVLLCPLLQTDFAVVLYMVILGGAGGVEDTEIFQRAPEIADEKTGEWPERRV